ncbi:MAG: 4Fe-4S binding protein [Candidatus Bathyarchaeota archaeon]|nr:MAG: 4Fe-4S binding protein [Candidatus Bathyarchaeota archaeon]
MTETTYKKLAEHLDGLPGGFAPSETGAELRLLQRLFNPEEAELATHLTLDREEARAIASRAKLPLAEAQRRLNEMSEKGLIFSVHPENGPALYQAVPWVVGIYEFQVNRLSEEFLEDLSYYWSTTVSRTRPETIPQMRTIPIGKSIDQPLDALPYEQVEELVKAHDRFAVAPCICRRQAKMTGRGCDAPEESCLLFGDFADFYVKTGRGRPIDQSEVMNILAKANEANLVLNPTNSKFVAAICCCCGCCCGILRGLQSQEKPSAAVASSFIADFEPEKCINCGVCLERCQMQALSAGAEHVAFNSDRCIGCGLCVSTCTSGALTLTRKPESLKTEMPATVFETWRTIAKEQAGKQ